MRVQLRKRSHHGSIGHSLHVYGIDIVLLNLLKNEIELSPTVVVPVEFPLRIKCFLDGQCTKHSQDNAQERYDNGFVYSFHIDCQTFSTSIPAFRSRSIPSVILYSSR